MFLRSLRLRDVRCFRELDLSFDEAARQPRKWTLLLGDNGLGKSTVLRAIALATCGSDALAVLLGDPSSWIRNNASRCEIHAVVMGKGGGPRKLSIVIERGDSLTDVLMRSRESLEAIDEVPNRRHHGYFVSGYGASRRLGGPKGRPAHDSPYPNPRVTSVLTLFDQDARLLSLESWAMDLDYRKEYGLDLVSKVLTDFLPDVSFARIDRDARQLLFQTADGLVPLDLLSDGYQNVAGWIGDLLFHITDQFHDHPDPLSVHGLLLIDELSLHLHPQWQRHLMQYLGNYLPNFQIVGTTHSPVTAQQSGEGTLFTLRRTRGAISLEQFRGNPGVLLLSQLLMTDAFGLETDESREVEHAKNRYRELSKQARLSKAEARELEKLTKLLEDLPVSGRSHMMHDEADIRLLQAIQQELEEREK